MLLIIITTAEICRFGRILPGVVRSHFAIAEILNLWLVAGASQHELMISMCESASVLLAPCYAGNVLKEIDNYKSELECFVTANPYEISRCYALVLDHIEGSLR
jgi:hypothetical protein